MGFLSRIGKAVRGIFERPAAWIRERREERREDQKYKTEKKKLEDFAKKKVEEYEKQKRQREREQRKQKRADHRKRERAFRDAYTTFRDRYDMSRAEYKQLIDVWGGVTQDMKDIFGDSRKGDGSLVYAYRALNDADRKRFPEILKGVMNDIENKGYNQEQAINALYDRIDELNAGGM